MSNTRTIQISNPFADPDIALEPPGAIAQVKSWWPLLERVLAAPRRGQIIQQLAQTHGLSPKTIEKKFYDWRRSSFDWRILIDRAKYPAVDRSHLPASFVQYWRDLYLSHQRDTSGKSAYEMLLGQLLLWERDPLNPELAIPGYERPPKRNKTSRVPQGWSYENLMRRLPDKYTRTLVRQGPKAASVLLPKMHTSREQLAFGQYIYFDDSEHDNYVNLTGINGAACRPLSFNALEGLSSSLIELLLKPQIEGPDGKLTLNQLDFFWFVVLVLTKHGYNAKDGTRLIFEWRTANVDKDSNFDELINRLTNGAVSVDRSGKFGNPAFKAMLFGGQPSGNYRFKAPLESFFNLLRNRSGFLPAPTGRNIEMAPEESYGLTQYNNQVQRMIEQLPEHVFLRLARPVKEWEDYCLATRIIHDYIDLNRNHNLQGWAKLGFKTHRYRLSLDSEHWMGEREYLALPAEVRTAYDHIVSKPGYYESENLSRREVYQMHRHLLTKLPVSAVPLLAPQRAWEPITVAQDLEMTIKDKFVDSEPLRYVAIVRNPQGHEIHLQRGETYLRLLNPFDPSQIWIAEGSGCRKGQLIGLATRIHQPCKTDADAMLSRMSELNHIRANQSKEAIVHLGPEAARRVAMRKTNATTIDTSKTEAPASFESPIKVSARSDARASLLKRAEKLRAQPQQ